MDVVGPLPESNGFKYLFTVLDRASNWFEAYPMKRDSKDECARSFMEWVSRFGLPSRAISDNGNAFVSNLFKDIMDTFNIKVNFHLGLNHLCNEFLKWYYIDNKI